MEHHGKNRSWNRFYHNYCMKIAQPIHYHLRTFSEYEAIRSRTWKGKIKILHVSCQFPFNHHLMRGERERTVVLEKQRIYRHSIKMFLNIEAKKIIDNFQQLPKFISTGHSSLLIITIAILYTLSHLSGFRVSHKFPLVYSSLVLNIHVTLS